MGRVRYSFPSSPQGKNPTTNPPLFFAAFETRYITPSLPPFSRTQLFFAMHLPISKQMGVKDFIGSL